MTRVNYRLLVYYFLIYVVVQLPLLHKFVLFDVAFGFFYLGFLLLIPFGINPFLRIGSGFMIGLLIDIFSNTPGLHAAACTFVMFVRDNWLRFSVKDVDENVNLSIYRLGIQSSMVYLIPLVFLHHTIIFWVEHGKLDGFFIVFQRILMSTLFTYLCITLINLVVAKKPRRL